MNRLDQTLFNKSSYKQVFIYNKRKNINVFYNLEPLDGDRTIHYISVNLNNWNTHLKFELFNHRQIIVRVNYADTF